MSCGTQYLSSGYIVSFAVMYAMGLLVGADNAITAATKAACSVLRVDKTIKNGKELFFCKSNVD